MDDTTRAAVNVNAETTTDRNETIGILNHLITTCKDGENGFSLAADAIDREDMKTLFTELSAQRAQFAHELQGCVTTLGGNPTDHGTPLATLHRGWIDIKAAITGHSDHAIIAECERGEDAAVKSYEHAIEKALPADCMAVIRRQFQDIKAAHDKVHGLELATDR